MATAIIQGQTKWSVTRDSEGHREYKIIFRIRGAKTDGPFTALNTPGLPTIGSPWNFDSDSDPWAYCLPNAVINPIVTNEPNTLWSAEFTFSTKPPIKPRCQDIPIEDPLLEPPRLSGGSSNAVQEATHDRFGRPILNSAFEQIRGPQVEFDTSHDTVTVEMNVPIFNLALLASMKDTVNLLPMWGMPPRTIKLVNYTWEEKYYGQCNKYYTLKLEFEVRAEGFDRDLLDEGTKVLRGDWVNQAAGSGTGVPPRFAYVPHDGLNIYDPTSYVRFKDTAGENSRVILNGRGLPAEVASALDSRFVSVVDSNLGNSLSDPDYWLPLLNVEATEYSDTTSYQRGYLVTDGVSTYVAAESNLLGITPASNPTKWIDVGGVIDAGNYNIAITYAKGAYVLAQAQTNIVGSIHVEKYNESNFFILGIPALL